MTDIPDYLRPRLEALRLCAGKPKLRCYHTLDRGMHKMNQSKPAFAHIYDLPGHGFTRVAHKFDGQVNLMAEISAVLAFHPGKRYVKEASKLLVLNRLAEHKIRPRFNRRTHRSCAVHDGDDHRLLVGATAAYLGEHIGSSRDIVTVNDEAVETAAS